MHQRDVSIQVTSAHGAAGLGVPRLLPAFDGPSACAPSGQPMETPATTGILRAAKFLIDSRRHDPEIERIFGERFLGHVRNQRSEGWSEGVDFKTAA